ncbi:MAG: hypothetical protein M1820_008343 [Bogoriella megaspora]|nr:MAG: hypothetical protein M1820_008343 [Bogoriella megaspora]
MVKVVERPKAELPDPPDGQVWHAMPPHSRFLDDPFYYDTFGRDPFDQVKFWETSDPAEKAEKLAKIIEDHKDGHPDADNDDEAGQQDQAEHVRQLMFTAAVKGDEETLRTLVKTGTRAHPKPNTDENQTRIPLFAAAANGNLGCVKILVKDAGLSVEAKNEMGETPLLTAALGDDIEIVRWLLGEGADPRVRIDPDNEITHEYVAPDWRSANALELAAWKGHLAIVKLLLEHPFYGSTRKRKNRNGEEDGIWVTPLAIKGAATSGNHDLFKLLLERGAYPVEAKNGLSKGEQLSDEERDTIRDAVSRAALNGDLQTLKTLLTYIHPVDDQPDLDPFSLPEELKSGFMEGAYNAAATDQPEKFEFLYKSGVKERTNLSLNYVPEEMRLNLPRMLEIAAQNGALSIVKLLVSKYKIDPDAMRRPPCMTPMYVAAANKKPEIVRYLLENYTIDLHKGHGRFITGTTPLWVASSLYSGECAILLLQHGGPVDHFDTELLKIDEPTTAVLINSANSAATVRLLTEANADKYLEHDTVSRSILFELDPKTDKDWLQKLQTRRSPAELRDEEEMGNRKDGGWVRDLDREEEDRLGHLKEGEEEDPKKRNPEFPTIKEREDEMHDTDWVPAWVPAGSADGKDRVS